MADKRIPWTKLVDNLTGLSTEIVAPTAKATQHSVAYTAALFGPRRLAADNKAAQKDPEAKILNGARRYQLLCGGCRGSATAAGAEVHWHGPSLNRVGGMLRDIAGHFASNPHQIHVNCDFRAAAARSPKKIFDDRLGYGLNLNINGVASHFNARSLVRTDAAGRVIHHDPAIAELETKAIHSAADLVKFINTCPLHRLRQTVVVHNGYDPIPWQDFCIRRPNRHNPMAGEPQAGARFIELVEKLQRRRHNAAFPVFMEMSFIRPVTPRDGATTARGISRALYWKDSDDEVPGRNGLLFFRKSHHIQPRVVIENVNNPLLANVIPEAGSYFILGHARLETQTASDHVTHTLEIRVTRPDQIIAFDAAEMSLSARPTDRMDRVSISSGNSPVPLPA